MSTATPQYSTATDWLDEMKNLISKASEQYKRAELFSWSQLDDNTTGKYIYEWFYTLMVWDYIKTHTPNESVGTEFLRATINISLDLIGKSNVLKDYMDGNYGHDRDVTIILQEKGTEYFFPINFPGF